MLCCFFVNCSAFAWQGLEQIKKTILVVGENLPPVTNPDGTGQQFEVVKAILAPLGYDIRFKVFPYRRAFRHVEIGQADMMIGLLKEPKRQVLYAKYPHDADDLLAIYKHEQWQGVYSLNHKRLVTLAGLTSYFKKQLPNNLSYTISEVETREQAINKLNFRRADFFIDSQGSFDLSIAQGLTSGLNQAKIGYMTIDVAFSQTVIGRQLRRDWDQHFISFIQTSEAKAIYEKWDLEKQYLATLGYFKREGVIESL